MTTEEYLIARKSKNWRFKKIVNEDSFMNVNRVHPLKQKLVRNIVEEAKKENVVKRIIIFGSSIRYDCDITSDLDICIDWMMDCYDENGILLPFTQNMRKCISFETKGRADVVNYDYLEDTVLAEAVKEGVVVYEYHV
jgi:predicted nucleotidyltransferase